MKIKDKRKLISTVAAIFLFCLAAAAAIISGFALAPDIVSYSVSTDGNPPDTQQETKKCLYGKFSEITEDGPFEIKCTGKNIYILKNDSYLYLIRAPLERFTAADVSMMHKGITVETLGELSELVQHLES